MKRSLIIPVFLLSGMCLAAGCGSKNNVDLSSAHTTEAETMAQTDEPEPETEETEEPASQAEGSSRPDSSRGLSTSLETYTSGKVSIQYPVVSGLNSADAETAYHARRQDPCAYSQQQKLGVQDGEKRGRKQIQMENGGYFPV